MKTRSLRGLLLLWAGLFCCLNADAANLMPIYEPLRLTESEHFTYLYQESLEPQLPDLARACEDAWAILNPVFKWTPGQKIRILYSDAWDEHNGSASPFPRPTIMVYAADVSPGSSIYQPGHFIRSTLFHEYAHILPLDARYGIPGLLSGIFGRVQPVGDPLSTVLALCAMPPGALAPDWYLEGLSIWSETEFVGPGRGRNAVADMIMRMPVADDRVLAPEQWDLRLPEWPYGEAAYLYGMRAIQYVCEKYNEQPPEQNLPAQLADSVAHSFLYYFDAQAFPITGHSFAQLAVQSIGRELDRQEERIARLKTVPLMQTRKLTPDRLQVASPKFGPDGASVFFSGNTEADRDTLFRYDLGTGGLTKLRRPRTQTGLTRLAMSADRGTLYYTRLNVVGRDRMWSELRAYDVNRGENRRITGKGRYRFPALCPDGRTMAAVRNEAGRRILVEVPLDRAGDTRAEIVRAEAPEFHSLVDPVYSPDGRSLVYVRAGAEGSEIRRVDLADGRDEALLQWPCLVISPAFHPSGDALVFSSDRSGVYNLYRMKPEAGAEPGQLTHVLGGLFQPDFSPDGKKLAVAAYDSFGYHLAVLDYDALRPMAHLPELKPDWKSLSMNATNVEAVSRRPAPALAAPRPYRSLGAVRPDFWSPWLTASDDSVQGGLAAGLSDPAGYQSLLLLGGYDANYDMPVGAATYGYSGFYPILTIEGSHRPVGYPDLVEDANKVFYDYDEKAGVAGGTVTLPWETVDRQVLFSLGYKFSDREAIEKSAEKYAGRALLTTNLFEGGEGAVFGEVQFLNATAFGRSLSLEQGRYISAAVEVSDPALGGDLSRTRALAQWNEYMPLPWGENHVLKLEGLYGAGSGDQTAQGFFGVGGFGAVPITEPGIDRVVPLRGYLENYQVGRHVAKAGAAYRFPLRRSYKGASATMPVYYHQLFGELYYEGGQAWGDEPAGQPENEWLNAVGAELNFSMTLLRFVDMAPGLGVVYAFDREYRRSEGEQPADDKDERAQVYFSIKAAVNF